MAVERVGDMTLEELKQFVDERIRLWFPSHRKLSVKEFNERIRRHRWTPPEGAPSNLELLREDRDR